MAIEITMPRLSDTMEVGTIVSWNVKEGDAVSAGDVLADIETDKATMELQNFDDGTVAAVILGAGQETEVGSLMMVLAEEGEDPAEVREQYASGKAAGAAESDSSAETSDSGSSEESSEPTTTSTSSGDASAAATRNGADRRDGDGHGERIFASPLARKIAKEHDIDLGGLTGSGPSGRIVRKDVEAAVSSGGAATPKKAEPQAPSAAPAPEMASIAAELSDEKVNLTNMRKTIARRLVESKQSIPHYQVTVTVDMDPLMALRKQLNDQLSSQGVKLSVNDFLVRACALAMHQHPHINSSWDDGAIQLHGRVNVGVAVALSAEQGGGLVVATLRDADRMGLRHISSSTKSLAEKARSKGLTIEEMADATFTISNLGMFGVDHFTAIINPPNSAILAVGAAVQKPVVRDGQIVIGHEMSMTMSSDHRVIDGAMAAAYLGSIREYLEKPATLLV